MFKIWMCIYTYSAMYIHRQLFKLKNKIFTFIGVFKFWRLLLPAVLSGFTVTGEEWEQRRNVSCWGLSVTCGLMLRPLNIVGYTHGDVLYYTYEWHLWLRKEEKSLSFLLWLSLSFISFSEAPNCQLYYSSCNMPW